MLEIIAKEKIRERIVTLEKCIKLDMKNLSEDFNGNLEFSVLRLSIWHEQKEILRDFLNGKKDLDEIIKLYLRYSSRLPHIHSTNPVKVLQDGWRVEAFIRAIDILTNQCEMDIVVKKHYQNN
jgi:hypothetical protein